MYTINFPRTRNWLNKGWKFSPLHSTVADLTSQDKLLKSLLAKRKSHNFADFLQHSMALPGKTWGSIDVTKLLVFFLCLSTRTDRLKKSFLPLHVAKNWTYHLKITNMEIAITGIKNLRNPEFGGIHFTCKVGQIPSSLLSKRRWESLIWEWLIWESQILEWQIWESLKWE